MTMPIEQFLNTFMKACVIHNDHAFGLKAWNKGVFTPVVEYIAVDVLLKVIKRKQHLFIESTDDIGTFFSLPVVAIDTRFAYRCIAKGTNGLMLETAFIHIDNGIALLNETVKLTLISRSFYRTGLWML